MKTITLTSKDFAEKMYSSYNLMVEGFKDIKEHHAYCYTIRTIAGDEMYAEICNLAKEMLNANKMNIMRKIDFTNEKRMQRVFGLRYAPDRYTSIENAKKGLKFYVKPHRIVRVNENPMGLTIGWYVVCPADAERLHKETEGLITYA